MKWLFSRFSILELSVLARSAATPGSMRRAASAKHPRLRGAGAGEGIVPGASGWVTVTLAPGQYELVCNLAGHYTAGMYTQLTVT